MRTKGGDKAVNKRNHHIAKTSPPQVFRPYIYIYIYHTQFQQNFHFVFEVTGSGRLVTTIASVHQSDDPENIWEMIGMTLNDPDVIIDGHMHFTWPKQFEKGCGSQTLPRQFLHV